MKLFAALAALCIVVVLLARRRRANPWNAALADPATRRALDAGLADLEGGRVRPWFEPDDGWGIGV